MKETSRGAYLLAALISAAGVIIATRCRGAQLLMVDPHNLTQPPSFCQYADGACDQCFTGVQNARTLFLYPSEPQTIASTIAAASAKLHHSGPVNSITWRDIHTAGQIIFCEICKASRFAQYVIADVTTLNFNLMFEDRLCSGPGSARHPRPRHDHLFRSP